MSESNATGADPRYDPRFQRGYSGGAEADAPGVPSRSSQQPESELSRPERESLDELERRASERTAPQRVPEARIEAFERHQLDGAEPAPRLESTGDPTAEHPDDPVIDPADDPGGLLDAPLEAGPSGARWYWIAIGACLVAIVIGALIYWTQVSDPGIYSGAVRSGIDETTRMFLSAVAPALVQGGIIGAIAVLVVWASWNTRSGKGRG
jgi:hypothetical protein